MMQQGVQTFLGEVGEAGCYALAIIHLAERITGRDMDVVKELEKAVSEGFIIYNPDNTEDTNNLFVESPDRFLSSLTGKEFTIKKIDYEYLPKPGEFVIYRWERTTTKCTYSHFRLPDFDTLQDSQTVKFGKIVSTRVFTAC